MKTTPESEPEADKAARFGNATNRSVKRVKPGTGATAARAAVHRILITGDDAGDAELLERLLRQAGIRFTAERAATKSDFIMALHVFEPEVVIAAAQISGFDGLEAVRLARQWDPEVAVILIGAMPDGNAADAGRSGATDFIVKSRLGRIGFSVRRALSQVAESRKRRLVQTALRSSEMRYRGLFETASEGILILDGQRGVVIDVNPYMVNLLGYPAESYRGKALRETPPFTCLGLDDDGWQALEQKVRESRETLSLPAKDGRIVDVELVGSAYDTGDSVVLQWNIRDISERKESARRLERVNRALKTLSAGNAALTRAENEQELLDTMCRIAVEEGGYRLASIFYAEHDAAKSVTLKAHSGEAGDYPEHANLTWGEGGRSGVTGAAIRTGKPQIVQNIATDPRAAPWRAALQSGGLAAGIGLPLKEKDVPFGAMTIISAQAGHFDPEETELLTELANDLSYGIVALRDRAKAAASVERLHDSLESTVAAIAGTIELRDPYTTGHQKAVAQLAVEIATALGLSDAQVQGIRLAGLIHDVGKISVPAEILSKSGRLSQAEFDLIRSHPVMGYNIVRSIAFPWPVAEPILQHHERMDGSGYPYGVDGEGICMEARVLAVADVVEAMNAHRPYRPALGLDAALAEIENGKGRLYDPRVVDVCIELFRDKRFAFQ